MTDNGKNDITFYDMMLQIVLQRAKLPFLGGGYPKKVPQNP